MGLAETAEIKASCCIAWQHPVARLLLGDHLHPGGKTLTEDTISSTQTEPGDVVLDVGCGNGAALRLIAQRGMRAMGVDLSEAAAREAADAGSVLVGDGERLPISEGSVDAVILECVLSLLPEKGRALQELGRVVKPGGRVIVSDMVAEAPLPVPLQGIAAWSSCIGGALSSHGYQQVISASGLDIISTGDHSADLTATLEQVARRLSLLEIPTKLGAAPLSDLELPADIFDRARAIIAQLVDQVRGGVLGYISIIGQRP